MDQADRYSNALDAAILRLADNPFLAPPVNIVASGVRRLAHQAHAIFYRVESDEVLVLRVLHQSRDAGLWVG
jgi:toxin ParE1/3/4